MNWSLILNVCLLTGVVLAIVRMVSVRGQLSDGPPDLVEPTMSADTHIERCDDVIAVRKLQSHALPTISAVRTLDSVVAMDTPLVSTSTTSQSAAARRIEPTIRQVMPAQSATRAYQINENSLLVFLLAKANRQLAGYELLQTILSVGLRFGEGQLFHRHHNPNGQGPVLCSLATATPSGVFDLQNIGGFSVHGLCLFMQTSSAPAIDLERFRLMMDTAKQLSEGLDTYILDDQRKPWSHLSETRYLSRIGLPEPELVS